MEKQLHSIICFGPGEESLKEIKTNRQYNDTGADHPPIMHSCLDGVRFYLYDEPL